MAIAFMNLANQWNAYRLTAPVVPHISNIQQCHDKHSVIIVLNFDYKNASVHFTCMSDREFNFTAFHITEGDADIFASGAKKSGSRKFVGKGEKKKYYDLAMAGAAATRTANFTATEKVWDSDKEKTRNVVSDTIDTAAERDILALMRDFLVFADP